MYKILSLFDGSGGFPLAAKLCGIEPVAASEVEPYPIAVTRSRFPNMVHLGDVSKIDGGKITPVDVISFGSPCFPAGTLVLTDSRYKPIEEVQVGDLVLTHLGRWRKVVATGHHEDKTVVLKGNHFGLECTPNHPIYSRQSRLLYGRVGNKRIKKMVLLDPEWTPAEEMNGKLWATPRHADQIQVDIPQRASLKQKGMPKMDVVFWTFVGRWLGDGWVCDGQRSGRPDGQMHGDIYLCDSLDKRSELEDLISGIGQNCHTEITETGVKVRFTNSVLCEWLTKNFGRGAKGKRIPSWVYGLNGANSWALLEGVMASDGYKVKTAASPTWKIVTTSLELAYGLRMLCERHGFSTSVYRQKKEPKTIIQGREVNQSDYYEVKFVRGIKRKHHKDVLHSWYRVRSVTPTGETKTVYNLEVEEDNSYVAGGIVVHNCQDLSVAGKRAGLKHEDKGDEETTRSGLFMEAIRIIKEMRNATANEFPRFALWENVPGAFSSNKGEDFRIVLEEFVRIVEPTAEMPAPEKGRWPYADVIVGDGFSVGYRTLDLQYWGCPQRRRRIYLVADFRDERGAFKVLFERQGLRGYFTEGGTPWEESSSDAEGGT